jgi:hypothetical protein
MIGLDPSLLAPEVTYVLMQRGANVPPVQWQDRPSEPAKRHLAELDDAKLLNIGSPANKEMAAAVRAMLYLWNGWLEECTVTAKAAGEKERAYLAALCQRHLGQPAQAKEQFRAVETHPVYEALAKVAVQAIKDAEPIADKRISRFKQIMEIDPVWEAYAFVDLYELARADKLDRIAHELVRNLQCREWETLFAYCYEGATGQKLPDRSAAQAAPRERKRPVQKPKKKDSRHQRDQLLEAVVKEKDKNKASAAPRPNSTNTVPVRCPKCGTIQQVPEAKCGDVVRCAKCPAFYAVPARYGAPLARKG